VLAAARRVPGAAAAVTGRLDVEAALARRDYMTSSWDDAGQEPWLRTTRSTCSGHRPAGRPATGRGHAADGTVTRLTARRAIVLAPDQGLHAPIDAWPSPALDQRGSDGAEGVPARLIVLGGGAVGVEMAQAIKRLGASRSP